MGKHTKNFEEFSLDEKWGGNGEVESTGQYGKKTVAELKKSRGVLKKKKDRTAAESKRLRQINFAIRAKIDWGKIKDSEDIHLVVGDAVNEKSKPYKLQSAYDDFEEFEHYDDLHGLAKRLGFKDAAEAWEADPLVQGSTNPKDYKVVKEDYEMDVEGVDMVDEHAKAVLSRAVDNSKALDNVQLKAAFDEICEENDVPEDTPELIKASLENLLKDLSQQAKALVPEEFVHKPAEITKNRNEEHTIV